jgi:hypothetical protein
MAGGLLRQRLPNKFSRSAGKAGFFHHPADSSKRAIPGYPSPPFIAPSPAMRTSPSPARARVTIASKTRSPFSSPLSRCRSQLLFGGERPHNN